MKSVLTRRQRLGRYFFKGLRFVGFGSLWSPRNFILQVLGAGGASGWAMTGLIFAVLGVCSLIGGIGVGVGFLTGGIGLVITAAVLGVAAMIATAAFVGFAYSQWKVASTAIDDDFMAGALAEHELLGGDVEVLEAFQKVRIDTDREIRMLEKYIGDGSKLKGAYHKRDVEKFQMKRRDGQDDYSRLANAVERRIFQDYYKDLTGRKAKRIEAVRDLRRLIERLDYATVNKDKVNDDQDESDLEAQLQDDKYRILRAAVDYLIEAHKHHPIHQLVSKSHLVKHAKAAIHDFEDGSQVNPESEGVLNGEKSEVTEIRSSVTGGESSQCEVVTHIFSSVPPGPSGDREDGESPAANDVTVSDEVQEGSTEVVSSDANPSYATVRVGKADYKDRDAFRDYAYNLGLFSKTLRKHGQEVSVKTDDSFVIDLTVHDNTVTA